MIQVINNQIVNYNLPKIGTLKSGESVSGYHLLDQELLKNEGWLPLEDVKPNYDEQTQCLVSDGYEILEDRVIKKYKITEAPEPMPNELEMLKIEDLNNKEAIADLYIMIMMGGI